MLQIALDAMGGDRGTTELVAGAIEAVRRYDVCVTLLGDQQIIDNSLAQFGSDFPSQRLTVIHAPQVISLDETPFDAIRKKKDSSIVHAFLSIT